MDKIYTWRGVCLTCTAMMFWPQVLCSTLFNIRIPSPSNMGPMPHPSILITFTCDQKGFYRCHFSQVSFFCTTQSLSPYWFNDFATCVLHDLCIQHSRVVGLGWKNCGQVGIRITLIALLNPPMEDLPLISVTDTQGLVHKKIVPSACWSLWLTGSDCLSGLFFFKGT